MAGKGIGKITWEDFKKSPWWTWLFVVACVVLPVTTLGGAIPVVCAVLGALLCVRVAAAPEKSIPVKLLACFGITIAAWGLAYLFIFSISVLMR